MTNPIEFRFVSVGSDREAYDHAHDVVTEEVLLIRTAWGLEDDAHGEGVERLAVEGVPVDVTVVSANSRAWRVDIHAVGTPDPYRYEFNPEESDQVRVFATPTSEPVILPKDVNGAGALDSLRVVLVDFSDSLA